ncbi:MAG: class I SAM-dependent methyltransferase [Butyrivibrio sp.]|nr:class I SAM-dependent methyltransferase [Butyrivibrio sp.]
MWIADGWKEYEVLDTAGGEKLERWGDYTLIRPDPQVIWEGPKTVRSWHSPNGHYHRSNAGGGSWSFNGLPETWSISYETAIGKRLSFRLKPFHFKHTGLFPEQAVNWDWFMPLIREAGREIRVLNLFAYTGGATTAAAAAGASVVHVDAAKNMVQWAKENTAASGLSEAPVRYFVDDCVKLVEREIRRGNRYEAIILDPPSYGRGPGGETWKLETSLHPFLTRVAELLSDEPLFLLLNSYTTGLQPATLTYLLQDILRKRFPHGQVDAQEIGLPVRESGLILPCGASARWRP